MKHKKQILSILVEINKILLKNNLRTFKLDDIAIDGDGLFWDTIVTNKQGIANQTHRKINEKLDELRNSLYLLMR